MYCIEKYHAYFIDYDIKAFILVYHFVKRCNMFMFFSFPTTLKTVRLKTSQYYHFIVHLQNISWRNEEYGIHSPLDQ